ncbi:putative low-density lipoprotein receptor-related protein 6-like [Apostichopus japonicus]|uniref:Putative low-density lipoprotein receptor-related protein 6-like n=1 Tax=Stichopus japonicus TaxID=307972 RepID=A0A2G8L0J1_STIJA|nr:putative low-density lipoprotein receptor-related protein 6-like [Apostichopus japonicus]
MGKEIVHTLEVQRVSLPPSFLLLTFRYLYWSDWGDPSRIERSSLDGTNRTTLINTPEGWPNGIAIDYKKGRIMWGTAKYRKIESADMEGTNRSVIVDNTRHIFGFSLGGESVVSTNDSELAGPPRGS